MSAPDISIISSGASLADARLHRITNALIRSGRSVEIFAPGDHSDAPQGATIRKVNQGRGFAWRLHRAFYSPWQAKGRSLYCLAPEAQVTTWLACTIRNQIYFADIYEDYLALLRDRKWTKRFLGLPGLLGSLIAQSSTFFASRAAVTTVADVQVPPFSARQRIVLRNLPDLTHLTQSGALGDQPRAIYIGDVRESRGLHMMLQSAVLAPHWHFDIIGPISEQDAQWIYQWSTLHEDAVTRITFHGRLSPERSWKLARGAWVGLSLLQPTPAFMAAIPSKLYEYMSVGLAIISTPLPRSVELLHHSQAGAVADSPETVAQILQSWEERPELIEEIRNRALTWSRTNLDSAAEYGAMTTAIAQRIGS